MKLKGKVVLITGGGTGIGTAIAERFVGEGAKICISGRRQEMLDKVARSLPAGNVAICPGDVTKYKDVERMVETALKFGGRLDVVVNNAGIDPGGTVTDVDVELWRQVIEINLTGAFLVMKAAIPHMIRGGGAAVVDVAGAALSNAGINWGVTEAGESG
jgi:meso-butanediol dehydrogenase / (S,S)-butanediol dehydrogenase / diacetyl reductase